LHPPAPSCVHIFFALTEDSCIENPNEWRIRVLFPDPPRIIQAEATVPQQAPYHRPFHKCESLGWS